MLKNLNLNILDIIPYSFVIDLENTNYLNILEDFKEIFKNMS